MNNNNYGNMLFCIVKSWSDQTFHPMIEENKMEATEADETYDLDRH